MARPGASWNIQTGGRRKKAFLLNFFGLRGHFISIAQWTIIGLKQPFAGEQISLPKSIVRR
jgi:hypothetical protein